MESMAYSLKYGIFLESGILEWEEEEGEEEVKEEAGFDIKFNNLNLKGGEKLFVMNDHVNNTIYSPD